MKKPKTFTKKSGLFFTRGWRVLTVTCHCQSLLANKREKLLLATTGKVFFKKRERERKEKKRTRPRSNSSKIHHQDSRSKQVVNGLATPKRQQQQQPCLDEKCTTQFYYFEVIKTTFDIS
jgi:hypothetical protein